MSKDVKKEGRTLVHTTVGDLTAIMKNVNDRDFDKYHKHIDYELVLLTEGACEVKVSGTTAQFTAGDILMVGSHLPHATWSLGGECQGCFVLFRSELFPSHVTNIPEYRAISRLLDKSNAGLIFRSRDAQDLEQYREMFMAVHESDHIKRVCNLLILMELLGNKMSRGLGVSSLCRSIHDDDIYAAVKSCERYLRAHFSEYITLAQICDAAGANPSTLSRAFHHQTGESIFHYLIRLRIEAAAKLIRSTDLPITEISYRCGFETFPHFFRKFKEATKMAPSEYREKMSSDAGK